MTNETRDELIAKYLDLGFALDVAQKMADDVLAIRLVIRLAK